MSEARYVPNGEVQGDDRPIIDNGGSKMGDFSNSLGEASRADLEKGYCNRKSITDCTKSDKGEA